MTRPTSPTAAPGQACQEPPGPFGKSFALKRGSATLSGPPERVVRVGSHQESPGGDTVQHEV